MADIIAMQRDIRQHCVDCCGGARGAAAECKDKNCRLWKWRRLPEQLDLFNGTIKRDWIKAGVRFAGQYINDGPVWWADLYRAYRDTPEGRAVIHANWAGELAIALRNAGFVRLDSTRMSPGKKRRGSREFAWTREA